MAVDERQPGIGVDAHGGAVVDPTANVIALNEAAAKRQDDLREMNNRLTEARLDCLKEMAALRAEHAKEMARAEAGRLDAIHQVDVLVQTTATASAQATAENLRNQVASVAKQLADQRAVDTQENNKRISALELAISEGKGKEAVADPMLEKLYTKIDGLVGTKSEGGKAMWGYVAGAIALAYLLFQFAQSLKHQ
jgi:hypothetical protein